MLEAELGGVHELAFDVSEPLMRNFNVLHQIYRSCISINIYSIFPLYGLITSKGFLK